MAIEFGIHFTITSLDKAELLATVQWIATNHGSKVLTAESDGTTFDSTGHIVENTFNDMTTTIQALETQFSTRLSWRFTYRTVS